MATLSEKENFLQALRGETPEYIPRYNIGWSCRPSVLNGERDMSAGGVGVDIFGVEWAKDGSAIDASMPKMDTFVLEDIRQWRDVIHVPDFSQVDFEALAKEDLKNRDPANPLGGGTAAQGFFQTVMSTMGFTNGLIACYEDPEEVRAMAEYLCDFYLSFADDFLKYYKPDYAFLADDIAHERAPFLSVEMFEEIFEPVWRRYIGFFKDRGMIAVHHNCGKFEDYLDDLVDMGFNGWDPAQTSNDLVAVKKKFGNRLLICGGFDGRQFLPHLEVTEEEVRAVVKETLDALAPGGGFAFVGGGGPANPNPQTPQELRSFWIRDEFEKLRGTYY